jgi:hypothetical protein
VSLLFLFLALYFVVVLALNVRTGEPRPLDETAVKKLISEALAEQQVRASASIHASNPSIAAGRYQAYKDSSSVNIKPPFWKQADAPIVWPAPLLKPAGEEAQVQSLVTQAIKIYPRPTDQNQMVMCDTHKVVSLPPRRKPDITILQEVTAPREVIIQPGDFLPSAYYTVAVAEVKGFQSRPDGFQDEELGKLEGFLSDLMLVQPQRCFAVGFLTDSVNIQFVVLRKQVGHDILDISPCYLLVTPAGQPADGAAWLHGLLLSRPLDLGAHITDAVINGHRVEVGRHLGVGLASTVWAATLQKEDIVLKFHRDPAGLKEEADNLRLLAKHIRPDFQSKVSRLVGVDVENLALALQPVGRPFARDLRELAINIQYPRARHYCQLIDILDAAHNAGLVHRDLAPRNFYLCGDTDTVCGRALLVLTP